MVLCGKRVGVGEWGGQSVKMEIKIGFPPRRATPDQCGRDCHLLSENQHQTKSHQLVSDFPPPSYDSKYLLLFFLTSSLVIFLGKPKFPTLISPAFDVDVNQIFIRGHYPVILRAHYPLIPPWGRFKVRDRPPGVSLALNPFGRSQP